MKKILIFFLVPFFVCSSVFAGGIATTIGCWRAETQRAASLESTSESQIASCENVSWMTSIFNRCSKQIEEHQALLSKLNGVDDNAEIIPMNYDKCNTTIGNICKGEAGDVCN